MQDFQILELMNANGLV